MAHVHYLGTPICLYETIEHCHLAIDVAEIDRAGDFHSDSLHVVERYTPASPYHLLYEATIEDPKVFTRPWKISFPLYRRMEDHIQLLEFKCVPFTEELLYGRLRRQPGQASQ